MGWTNREWYFPSFPKTMKSANQISREYQELTGRWGRWISYQVISVCNWSSLSIFLSLECPAFVCIVNYDQLWKHFQSIKIKLNARYIHSPFLSPTYLCPYLFTCYRDLQCPYASQYLRICVSWRFDQIANHVPPLSSSSTNISWYFSNMVSIAFRVDQLQTQATFLFVFLPNMNSNWSLVLTLHWKLICSKFKPPSSGGAPNKVGPKTIDKLDIDIWLTDSFFLILIKGQQIGTMRISSRKIRRWWWVKDSLRMGLRDLPI